MAAIRHGPLDRPTLLERLAATAVEEPRAARILASIEADFRQVNLVGH